jgi:hypothetical protein
MIGTLNIFISINGADAAGLRGSKYKDLSVTSGAIANAVRRGDRGQTET